MDKVIEFIRESNKIDRDISLGFLQRFYYQALAHSSGKGDSWKERVAR